MWLGPVVVEGAQLLSDDDLDQVTAAGAGTQWSVDILNSSFILGSSPTPTPVSPTTPFASAITSIEAAAASAEAAKAVSGLSGANVAAQSLVTATAALETASLSNGIEPIIAGKETLAAAATILNSVPIDQVTPAIVEAATKVNQATAQLNQAALESKTFELTSAVKAVEEANIALTALPKIEGDVNFLPAIEKAVNSIKTAKEAISAASKAHAASAGSSQPTLVLKEGSEGSLEPVLRINFNTGNAKGSADIIPIVTRGAPGQPALTLDGATIANPNGVLPLTLVAETLMMNMNICYFCQAEKIIQDNNGFIIPIYTK